MKICFVDKTEFSYSFEDINKENLRGAETIIINLSKEISNLGHQVVVYNNCTNEYQTENYSWLNLSKIKNKDFNYDIVISNNDTRLLDYFNCNKKYVISHSLQSIEKFIRKKQLFSYLKNRPTYLLLGNYHKLKMTKIVSLFGNRIINYGVDDIFVNTKLIKNIDHNLSIFPSRSDRNLDILINVWKKHVNIINKNIKLLITPIEENLSQYNIFNREMINRENFVKDIIKCRTMIIPGHKAELYCLAASEASELCLPIITMGIGALSERVEHGISGLVAKNAKQFGDFIIEIFSNENLWNEIRNNLIHKRGQKSWNKAAISFLDIISN